MSKVILFVLALTVVGAPVFAVNVLSNGDFSNGAVGWTVWSATSWTDPSIAPARTQTCFTIVSGAGTLGLGGATNRGYNGVLYQTFNVAPSSTYTVSGNIFTNDNSQERFCEIIVLNSDAGWVDPSQGDFAVTAGGTNNHTGSWGPASSSGGYVGAWTGSSVFVTLAKISGTTSGTPVQSAPWQHADLSPLSFTECHRWSMTPDMTFTTAAGQSKATLVFHVGSHIQGTPWQCDIKLDNIQVNGNAPTPKPVYGINNRAVHDTIISTAMSKYNFKVWGKVSNLAASSFTLDDGSGAPVNVSASGVSGIANNDYASATGALSGEGSSRVLTAQASAVLKLQ